MGVVEGSALHCGYLTVPAEHSRPQGPTIRLAVAIFKASYSNPAPDPVVYLEGGFYVFLPALLVLASPTLVAFGLWCVLAGSRLYRLGKPQGAEERTTVPVA